MFPHSSPPFNLVISLFYWCFLLLLLNHTFTLFSCFLFYFFIFFYFDSNYCLLPLNPCFLFFFSYSLYSFIFPHSSYSNCFSFSFLFLFSYCPLLSHTALLAFPQVFLFIFLFPFFLFPFSVPPLRLQLYLSFSLFCCWIEKLNQKRKMCCLSHSVFQQQATDSYGGDAFDSLQDLEDSCRQNQRPSGVKNRIVSLRVFLRYFYVFFLSCQTSFLSIISPFFFHLFFQGSLRKYRIMGLSFVFLLCLRFRFPFSLTCFLIYILVYLYLLLRWFLFRFYMFSWSIFSPFSSIHCLLIHS